jgi:hypothetical protein
MTRTSRKNLSFEPNSMGIISIVLISTLLVPYASQQGISRLYDTMTALPYTPSPTFSAKAPVAGS